MPLQIFTIVGVLSTFNATKLMSFTIMTHMIPIMIINQSIIQPNKITLTAAVLRVGLQSQTTGMMDGMIHLIVNNNIIILENFIEIMIHIFRRVDFKNIFSPHFNVNKKKMK